MKEIGERLQWVREALGLSQIEISKIVDVHQTTWSLYEKGLRLPDQFQIPRIAGKLKISVSYLLGEGLDGVERDLAIRLAAQHPQLVDKKNTPENKDKPQP